MKQPLLVMSLLVIALATGCKKNEPAANTIPPPAQPDQPAAASADNAPVVSTAPAVAGAVAARPAVDISVTLNDLTRQARSYVASTHNVPKSFEEFVTANPGLQVPEPPPGKKYAFGQKMKVILVNR